MNESIAQKSNQQPGWKELWLKEDWWAVWIGLLLVLVAYGFFLSGSSIDWIAVAPKKWATLNELGADFAAKSVRYLVQCGLFLALFATGGAALGHRPKEFIPSFLFVYVISLVLNIAGAWVKASVYTLEPPLLALLLGLVAALDAHCKARGLFFAALLVTDINTQDSVLLVCGAPEFLRRIDYPAQSANAWELAGVVSRKKQLLPYLLQCLAGAGAS